MFENICFIKDYIQVRGFMFIKNVNKFNKNSLNRSENPECLYLMLT